MTTAGCRLKTLTSKNEAQNAGHEADYWRMADALRGSMDAAEYKHVVLGLVFLKYISDAFEEAHAKLEAEIGEGADPEDPDEYIAQNIPSRDWYDRRGEEIRLDFLLRPVPAVSATPGERLADPVAEPETLAAFIAETTPGGGVIAQMALTVLVFWLYMTAKLPESTWARPRRRPRDAAGQLGPGGAGLR